VVFLVAEINFIQNKTVALADSESADGTQGIPFRLTNNC